jgi:hypothetical protein
MKALLERLELCEATFNLDKDIDLLYGKSGFGVLDGLLRSGDDEKIITVFRDFIKRLPSTKVDSSELISPIAKKAHKINPVKISLIATDRYGSYYHPKEKIIHITLNSQALALVSQMTSTVGFRPIADRLKSQLGTQYERFSREFDANNVKGTIAHELSHWANDSVHNANVEKKVDRAQELGIGMSDYTSKGPTIKQDPVELDAQVHAIKVIKKSMKLSEYNKLTWVDIFQRKSSLGGNFRDNYDQMISISDYDDTMKRLIKRLNREGLLGKGMRNFPSAREFYAMER